MNRYVLIVDDDPHVRSLFGMIVRSAGFQVREAGDGEIALDMVAAEAPALILLDLMMPGMDGIEVYRRLQENSRTRSIPVIIVSAMNPVDLRGQLPQAPRFIQKSRFSMRELRENVIQMAG